MRSRGQGWLALSGHAHRERVLRLIDHRLSAWKRRLKPLAGPSALCAAALMRTLGLITYPTTNLSVQGIPLYMMIGWLSLVYVMDLLGWYRPRAEATPGLQPRITNAIATGKPREVPSASLTLRGASSGPGRSPAPAEPSAMPGDFSRFRGRANLEPEEEYAP